MHFHQRDQQFKFFSAHRHLSIGNARGRRRCVHSNLVMQVCCDRCSVAPSRSRLFPDAPQPQLWMRVLCLVTYFILLRPTPETCSTRSLYMHLSPMQQKCKHLIHLCRPIAASRDSVGLMKIRHSGFRRFWARAMQLPLSTASDFLTWLEFIINRPVANAAPWRTPGYAASGAVNKSTACTLQFFARLAPLAVISVLRIAILAIDLGKLTHCKKK